MDNLVWALIIVSQTANVSFSSGYPTKDICEDAISIAKYGVTVEEKKQADIAAKLREAQRAKLYQDSHPARPTTDQDKKDCYDNTKGNASFGSTSDYCTMEKDGVTRYHQSNSWLSVSYNSGNEIKYAKCVMVPNG